MNKSKTLSKPPASTTKSGNGSKPAHILVVDDDRPVLYTFRAILEHFGYRASEATSCDEAAAVLNAEHVDVIISDLDLHADMSGEKLLRDAVRIQPQIGCILLTGFADPETLNDLERRGVPVLFKPLEPTKLLAYIEHLLHQKAA